MDVWQAVRAASILAAGAVGGAVAALSIGRLGSASVEGAPEESMPPAKASRRIRDGESIISQFGRGQQRLEERVGALEERAEMAETARPDLLANSPAGSAVPSPEELERHSAAIRTRHERWRDEHAKETRDAAWARAEEAEFSAALQRTADRGQYEILQIDCRTTLCTAELEWASYSLASRGYSHALHLGVPGCESAILLEAPVDGSRPYRATARYDCEAARTGESQ